MDLTKTVTIRAMEERDLGMVLTWRNHPKIREFMLTRHEITIDEHRAWFAKASKDDSRRLMIAEDAYVPFGYVQFSNITEGGVADWGFYIKPDAPKGSGQKLGFAALNHAFTVLKLHKVCGQALAFNGASMSFHKRMGFVEEGVLREQCCIDGEYVSLVCFGLLSCEWSPE